jgi:hypothetical protein
MSNPEFSHMVEIDEEDRVLRIHRVFSGGRRQLFTETTIPPDASGPNLSKFAHTLGENILLDSPAARRILGI